MDATPREESVWAKSFSEQSQHEQLHDDSEAWRAVTGLLLTIVSIGVLLAIFTVWIVVG